MSEAVSPEPIALLPRAVLIVGRGRVGRSLLTALRDAGIEAEIASGREAGASPIDSGHELVLLAVPDEALRPTAERIAVAGPPTAAMFAHVSGACDLTPLHALRDRGHAVGSLHPLRAFPAVLAPEALKGITFALDASEPRLLGVLATLARALGGQPRPVGAGERALYHAAAAMASNHLVTLVDHAVEMLEAIGWTAEEALEALLPLVRGTVESLEAVGLPHALTGPVRRGDANTIAAHMTALRGDRRLAPAKAAYACLSASTVRLARKLELSDQKAAAVLAALREET